MMLLFEMRRAFALLTMLLVFHLNLVGSDLVCAKQAHNATHAGHVSHQHGAPQKQDCDSPIATECCVSQPACAPAIAAAAGIVLAQSRCADALVRERARDASAKSLDHPFRCSLPLTHMRGLAWLGSYNGWRCSTKPSHAEASRACLLLC